MLDSRRIYAHQSNLGILDQTEVVPIWGMPLQPRVSRIAWDMYQLEMTMKNLHLRYWWEKEQRFHFELNGMPISQGLRDFVRTFDATGMIPIEEGKWTEHWTNEIIKDNEKDVE